MSNLKPEKIQNWKAEDMSKKQQKADQHTLRTQGNQNQKADIGKQKALKQSEQGQT